MGRRRQKAPEATSLVGYIRVSTDEQARSGLGLEAQRKAITQYAELYSLVIGETIVDDGFSAKDLKRPGMKRVLDLLDHGQVSGIVVAKLDRLTRSVRDVGHLVEVYFSRGDLRMISVGEQLDTSTAGGRLVLNVLASVGQWEREAIGERTRAALRAKKDRGQRAGTIPYGYELDPRDSSGQGLRPCKLEQEAVAEARRLKRSGKTGQEIADTLTRTHLKAARGVRFYQPFVWKMLQPNASAPEVS